MLVEAQFRLYVGSLGPCSHIHFDLTHSYRKGRFTSTPRRDAVNALGRMISHPKRSTIPRTLTSLTMPREPTRSIILTRMMFCLLHLSRSAGTLPGEEPPRSPSPSAMRGTLPSCSKTASRQALDTKVAMCKIKSIATPPRCFALLSRPTFAPTSSASSTPSRRLCCLLQRREPLPLRVYAPSCTHLT